MFSRILITQFTIIQDKIRANVSEMCVKCAKYTFHILIPACNAHLNTKYEIMLKCVDVVCV